MEKKHNIDKYQGYPHYPANEDIMRAKNNNGREPLETEAKPPMQDDFIIDEQDDLVRIVPGTDADLTKEELLVLQASAEHTGNMDDYNLIRSSLDITDADGELLNEASMFTDMTGSDLDVPGSEGDDENEAIGEEDEANNLYSSGDNHGD